MHIYTLVFLSVILAFGVASLLIFGYRFVASVAKEIRPYDPPHPSKRRPFECGNEPPTPIRQRFHIRFFVVALLFVLFDVEVVFLYPLAVVLKQLGMYGLAELLFFVAVLVVGYVYVRQKGVLSWS